MGVPLWAYREPAHGGPRSALEAFAQDADLRHAVDSAGGDPGPVPRPTGRKGSMIPTDATPGRPVPTPRPTLSATSTLTLLALTLTLAATVRSVSAQEPSDLPAPLAARIDEAREACSDFEGGTLSVGWGAVRRVDLDGDLRPDWALDESAFACSSAASLFCGTGGCRTHLLVGEALASFLNRGWEVVTFGRERVVLFDVHGSDCGGINPTPCVEAVVWDGEAAVWRTVRAPPGP